MTQPRSDKAVSMDELAERCFRRDAKRRVRPEPMLFFRPRGNDTRSFLLTSLFALLVLIFALAGWWALAVILSLLAAIPKILVIASDVLHRRKIQASVSQGISAYERGEPWAVARVHEYAVEKFRNRVAEHRERMMGDSSEWGRARTSLIEAASDAQRSAAYWGARLRQEPRNEFAKSQKDVSERLEAKLAEAFEKLEARSAALRRFYNECDARLAAMDRHNRDLEEFRRLKDLSGRADMIVAHAEKTIHVLATAFVAEAQMFADALGGIAAVSIIALAGEAPLDNIDYFADRIIEGSDRDREVIEDLERRLAP